MSEYTFSFRLRNWYLINKRELPWRETVDPYLIWISEIILQQTRVQQGLDYYNRFVFRFPDVRTLGAAPLEEVLKYWQGLGYYSRARNLHAAAKQVMEIYGGEFPSDHKQILSLKGIGDYTAAAIASFAFKQPYAVLDGNVFRVLARIYGIDDAIDSGSGKKVFAELARELLDPRHPDQHNQAIMEFGALWCVPVSPDCDSCIFREECIGRQQGRVSELPFKAGKTKVRDRWFNYFQIVSGDHTWIHRRTAKDIWSHLYEFPLIETDRSVGLEELMLLPAFKSLFPEEAIRQSDADFRFQLVMRDKKHILSHQRIHASFYKVMVPEGFSLSGDYITIPEASIGAYAISRLTELFLETEHSL